MALWVNESRAQPGVQRKSPRWGPVGSITSKMMKVSKQNLRKRRLFMKRNLRFAVEKKSCYIANITLWSGGIWSLVQTPLKNFKTHEAKPSEFSHCSVMFESQIPNPTSPQRDVCCEHRDTKNLSDFFKILSEYPNFEWVFESNTTIFPNTTDFLKFWSTNLGGEWC